MLKTHKKVKMIKQLIEEYLELNGGYSSKSSIRWMYKRNENLWKTIVMETYFLPDTALPKQRIWHILHDVYEIPKCPITGKDVKWNENRYLTYATHRASFKDPALYKKRIDGYKAKTGYDHWKQNPESVAKSNETFYQNLEAGNHKKQDYYANRSKDSKWYQSVQQSWTVEKRLEFSEVMKEVNPRWELSDEELTKIKDYYHTVSIYTNLSIKTQSDKIQNIHLRSPEFHIDHIYSRSEGYRNNVKPEIIGHWTNLRILSASKNTSKCARCDKTIEQLYEDYHMD